jgi:NAD-dependent dihydropyrimidine dehydrogenase PreA subunit
MVTIDTSKCVACGGCIDLCPVIAISMINDIVTIDHEKCTECTICVKVCPMRAPSQSNN